MTIMSISAYSNCSLLVTFVVFQALAGWLAIVSVAGMLMAGIDH